MNASDPVKYPLIVLVDKPEGKMMQVSRGDLVPAVSQGTGGSIVDDV
jgi:hypothetical protein